MASVQKYPKQYPGLYMQSNDWFKFTNLTYYHIRYALLIKTGVHYDHFILLTHLKSTEHNIPKVVTNRTVEHRL